MQLLRWSELRTGEMLSTDFSNAFGTVYRESVVEAATTMALNAVNSFLMPEAVSGNIRLSLCWGRLSNCSVACIRADSYICFIC